MGRLMEHPECSVCFFFTEHSDSDKQIYAGMWRIGNLQLKQEERYDKSKAS